MRLKAIAYDLIGISNRELGEKNEGDYENSYLLKDETLYIFT